MPQRGADWKTPIRVLSERLTCPVEDGDLLGGQFVLAPHPDEQWAAPPVGRWSKSSMPLDTQDWTLPGIPKTSLTLIAGNSFFTTVGVDAVTMGGCPQGQE